MESEQWHPGVPLLSTANVLLCVSQERRAVSQGVDAGHGGFPINTEPQRKAIDESLGAGQIGASASEVEEPWDGPTPASAHLFRMEPGRKCRLFFLVLFNLKHSVLFFYLYVRTHACVSPGA